MHQEKLTTQPETIDPKKVKAFFRNKEEYPCLRDVEGEAYKAADTLMELENQVMRAVNYGVEIIEGTEPLLRYFNKEEKSWDKTRSVGFMMYRNMRLVIDGRVDQVVEDIDKRVDI